jgi:hypothetical protein
MEFTVFAGLVAPVFAALIQKSGWSGKTQYFAFVAVTIFLTGLGYWASLYPAGWSKFAGVFAGILAVGQGVYMLLEPYFKQLRR